MIRNLITAACAAGLTTQQACDVIGLSPRTLQRWQATDRALEPQPDTAVVPARARPPTRQTRPYNALTAPEAALVLALIRSPRHADASCRDSL